jgi:hypothetical protein
MNKLQPAPWLQGLKVITSFSKMTISDPGEERLPETNEIAEQAAKRRETVQTLNVPTSSETQPSTHSAVFPKSAELLSATTSANEDIVTENPDLSTRVESASEAELVTAADISSIAESVTDVDAQDHESVDYIYRCICGDLDESFPGTDICCDGCEAWQHILCMGLSENKTIQSTEYFCEECRPGDHAPLLVGIKQGNDPGNKRQDAKMRSVVIAFKKSKKRKRRPSQYLRS